MTIPEALLETFKRNARVNEYIFEHLTPEDLALSDGKGGGTVLQLLSHMASSRGGWLLNMGLSPEHATEIKSLAGDVNLWEWQARDLTEMRAMFAVSDRATLEAVEAHLHSGEPFGDPHGAKAFPSDPVYFLPYMIVHDSHHRGQIMALLRQSGRSQTQLDALEEQWDIWRD